MEADEEEDSTIDRIPASVPFRNFDTRYTV